MKPASYWKKRFEALEQAQHSKSAAYVRGRMRRQFEHAMAQIEKELTAWYTKTAENNEISMAGARRMLTASEQQELQWSLDEYRAKCKEYAAKYKLGTKDEHLLQQLRNVTAKQAVTRLDALNLQLRMQLEDLYANHAGSMKEHLSDAYKESYYRSAYEIEKGTGVGAALHEMETKRAEMALAKPWVSDGKTFSNRIWKDKNKLVRTLQTELPQQFVRGESLPRIVKKVSERMNVAQSSASRLVMTESAFFATAGERETMKALDVKQFEFVATLDDRTSEECRAMDGKHFPLKDLKVGENAPPLHCWCRSCIVPYFGDEKDGGRAARNPVKGKTEIVPAEMTYPEWKSVYVDNEKTLDEWKNERENGKMEADKDDSTIVFASSMFGKGFNTTKAESARTKLVCDRLNAIDGKDADLSEIYGKLDELQKKKNVSVIHKVKDGKEQGYCSWYGTEVCVPKATPETVIGKTVTIVHEMGHWIDNYFGKGAAGSWKTDASAELTKAIKKYTISGSGSIPKELSDISSKLKKLGNDLLDKASADYQAKRNEVITKDGHEAWKKESKRYWKKLLRERDEELRNWENGYDPIEDIIDALSGGKARDIWKSVTYGHGQGYYAKPKTKEKEIFANYCALNMTNPEMAKLLKKYFPDLDSALHQIVLDMKKEMNQP